MYACHDNNLTNRVTQISLHYITPIQKNTVLSLKVICHQVANRNKPFYREIHFKIRWQEILLLLWSREFLTKWPAWDSIYDLWARLKTNKQQKPFWALWSLHKVGRFSGELKLKGSSQLQIRPPSFQLFPNFWNSHEGHKMGEILLEILPRFLLKEQVRVAWGNQDCRKEKAIKPKLKLCV